MARLREGMTIGTVLWAVVLGLACESASGRDGTKLVIYPQMVPAEAGKHSLLPPPARLTDGDAVPLYEKAVKALPDKGTYDQLLQYVKLPIDQLPADAVEQFLKQYIESLKWAAQAVKCRECRWPAWTPGTEAVNVQEYHRLVFAVRLWARLEIAGGECEGVWLPLQTGFGMARHLGDGTTLAHAQLGLGIAGAMCREIEQFVQMEGAPNLYGALAGLPKPFVDIEKAIESERKVALSALPPGMSSQEFDSHMKPAHDRTRAIAKRLDSDLSALQCVEAIRAFSASHGGGLPQTLAEITAVSIPKDAMCDAPFRYVRTGATAVLQSTVPAGGDKNDELRYEITVKN